MTTTTTMSTSNDTAALISRLVRQSRESEFDAFRDLQWPAELHPAGLWMTAELMTVHDTPYAQSLDAAQLARLSRFESLNFYSVNVHGIRELLTEVSRRIHKPGFELVSEFFHQFIDEENEHMWYFAKFCTSYGNHLYGDRSMQFGEQRDAELATFLVFARILIFEEIVDHFNVRMSEDASLDPFIRKLNEVHHADESRHIAFGRHIVKNLHLQLRSRLDAAALDETARYLARYIRSSIESLYNPLAYRDAGIADPYAFRAKVLASPARAAHHARWLKRTVDFLTKNDIVSPAALVAADPSASAALLA